jgi:hypothetical protein
VIFIKLALINGRANAAECLEEQLRELYRIPPH